MEIKLQDRTALLIGPFGATLTAVAGSLTQMGANVGLVCPKSKLLDRLEERVQKFCEVLTDSREANDRFGRATGMVVDIRDRAKLSEVPVRVAEAFGGLDILVDLSLATEARPFLETGDWESLYLENLDVPLAITSAAMRFLVGKKRGRVVFVIPDLLRSGIPGHSLASTFRSGLVGLSRTLARELQDSGVTVNCLACGITEEFLLAQGKGGSLQATLQALRTQIPQAEILDVEKFAATLAFLVSPLGGSITGQTIVASQGLSTLS